MALVREVVVSEVPEEEVLKADAREPLLVPESIQPVPSTGMLNER
jgi:hypothetical protein